MKKLVIIAIVGGILLGFSIAARAESVGLSVPLSMTVQAQFGFTLTDYSWNFGEIATGSGARKDIGVFCRSNHGVVWYMALNANPFTSGAGDVIPSDPGFTCAAWSGVPSTDPNYANGTFLYNGAVPAILTNFYQSTLLEGGDAFVPLNLALWVAVPSVQPSGVYTTDVVLTMHE